MARRSTDAAGKRPAAGQPRRGAAGGRRREDPGAGRKLGENAPWGIGLPVLCIPLWLLQTHGFEKALRALDAAWPNRASEFLVIEGSWVAMAGIATMIEVGLFCAVWYKCNVEKVTGLVPGRWLHYLLPGALCGVALTAMNAAINFAFIGGDAFRLYHTPMEAVAAHFFVSRLQTDLVAAIVEEFLFRGILYAWLRRHLSCAPSVLLSSSVFAFVHGYGWTDATILHFLSGAVFALSYERTRALAFPIIAHGIGNLSTTLLAILLTEVGYPA